MATQEPRLGSQTPGSTEQPSTNSSDDSALRKKEMDIFRSMLRTTTPMAPDLESSAPTDSEEEDPRIGELRIARWRHQNAQMLGKKPRG